MSELRKMYSSMAEDPFPGDLKITLGDMELELSKKTWNIDGSQKGLRYGENPDQPAALYELRKSSLVLGGVEFRLPASESGLSLVSSISEEHMLQAGKHPGKINLTDVDSGLNILQYLSAKPTVVILKHNNPSGAAQAEELSAAFEKAYLGDRIAAFGGTVVANRKMDEETARKISTAYFEVVAAPDFSPESLELLKTRKNLRILRLPGIARLEELTSRPFLDLKSLVDGGLVLQFSFVNRLHSPEDFLPAAAENNGITLTARRPTLKEAEDLLFAWAVEAGVTSNSVIFVRDGATLAIGTSEQDRVGCVEIAIHKAYTKYADSLAFQRTGLSIYALEARAKADPVMAEVLADIREQTEQDRAGLPGSVLVSDGFFPFRDGVDLAIAQGVTAIAQPGGSIRDFEVIEAVNSSVPQVAMVFTGQRSFKH